MKVFFRVKSIFVILFGIIISINTNAQSGDNDTRVFLHNYFSHFEQAPLGKKYLQVNTNVDEYDCIASITLTKPLTGLVDHEVQNRIVGRINNIIQPGAVVTYNAGNIIRLKPGFRAMKGSHFHALIDGCKGNLKIDRNADTAKNNLDLAIHPNPLSRSAKINYALVNKDEVTIYLFDATGKAVSVLFEGKQQEAGQHQVELDAQHLQKGMYYLKLKLSDMVFIKKLIIAE